MSGVGGLPRRILLNADAGDAALVGFENHGFFRAIGIAVRTFLLGLSIQSGIDAGEICVLLALRMEKDDGDNEEAFVAIIFCDVGEGTAAEIHSAIGEMKMDGIFSEDGIGDIGIAEDNVHIILIVLVHQAGFVRVEFHFVGADKIIFEDEAMMMFLRERRDARRRIIL